MTYTLADLRTLVRQRADMENSAFVTDTEANRYINDSVKELFELLVVTYGQEYFYTSVTKNTLAGQQSYAMPSDAFKLLRVDVRTADGYEPLRPWKFPASLLGMPTTTRRAPARLPRYRWAGNALIFEPEPSGTHWFRIHYVQRPERMDDDTDPLAEFLDDWAEFIVLRAAIKCLAKEESDASELTTELTMLRAHIVTTAPPKDIGYAQTIVDERWRFADNGDYDQGGWAAATTETVVESPFECAKIRSAADQSIPHNAITVVTLEKPEFNNSTSMDIVDTGDVAIFISTNAITIKKEGYYLVEWEAYWEVTPTPKFTEPTFNGATLGEPTPLHLATTPDLSIGKAILIKATKEAGIPMEVGLQAFQNDTSGSADPHTVRCALAVMRLGDL